jgi:hypothetical protein
VPPHPASVPDSCVDKVIQAGPAMDRMFQGDYLYTCRLKQAYLEYVEPRRDCSADGDCVVISADCPLNTTAVNRKHEAHVAAVRRRVEDAYHQIADCKSRNDSDHSPVASECVRGECQLVTAAAGSSQAPRSGQ